MSSQASERAIVDTAAYILLQLRCDHLALIPPPPKARPIPRSGRIPGYQYSLGSTVLVKSTMKYAMIVAEMDAPSTWLTILTVDGPRSRFVRVRTSAITLLI
jgi:hypothetical protein